MIEIVGQQLNGWRLFGVLFFATMLWRCEHDVDFSNQKAAFTVTYNPYQAVEWSTWKRCLSQHHDHVSVDEVKIRDYDEAGYQAVALLHYSGFMSRPYAETRRLWPLSKYLTQYDSDESFSATTNSLKFFIPSMEEIGEHHMTSPFLTTWIAKWEAEFFARPEPWHYANSQEAIDAIRRFGGLAIIAHPTNVLEFYLGLENIDGVEIYNASFAFHFAQGTHEEDENDHFLAVWDDLLSHRSSKIFGYAVNDWFGPFNKEVKLSHPDIFDSGKTVVLIEDFNLEDYRRSLETGAFFAVKDVGREKGAYPHVERIQVQPTSISIDVKQASVRWIFASELLHLGSVFDLTHLPANMNYIRAEVHNQNGTVYVQPFSIDPISN